MRRGRQEKEMPEKGYLYRCSLTWSVQLLPCLAANTRRVRCVKHMGCRLDPAHRARSIGLLTSALTDCEMGSFYKSSQAPGWDASSTVACSHGSSQAPKWEPQPQQHHRKKTITTVSSCGGNNVLPSPGLAGVGATCPGAGMGLAQGWPHSIHWLASHSSFSLQGQMSLTPVI